MQNPDETFENTTRKIGLGDKGYGMGVAIGDIDNDGGIDVYLTKYETDQLYLNQGTAHLRILPKMQVLRN